MVTQVSRVTQRNHIDEWKTLFNALVNQDNKVVRDVGDIAELNIPADTIVEAINNITTAGGEGNPVGPHTHPLVDIEGSTLGDIIVGGEDIYFVSLAGNTTTTKKFLNQTGTGAVSALPVWSALTDADIPDALTISGGTINNSPIGGSTPSTGAFTTISASGVITSTVTTGTAPFTIASTTVVPNLHAANSDQLLGGTWAVPGSIGSTTPNAGAFTTLSTTGVVTLPVGSAGAPTIRWSDEATSGIYRHSIGETAIGSYGSARMIWRYSNVLLCGVPLWSEIDGTAAAPQFSFLNDTGMGLYRSANDTLGFSTNGTERLTLSTTALTSTLGVAAPSFSSVGATQSVSFDTNSLDLVGSNDTDGGGSVSPSLLFESHNNVTSCKMKIYLNNNSPRDLVFATNSGGTAWTTLTAPVFKSNVSTGTAPFVVASTTVVSNLNVSYLLGATWAAPLAIGSTTPNTGKFTSLTIETNSDDVGNQILTWNDTFTSRAATATWAGQSYTLSFAGAVTYAFDGFLYNSSTSTRAIVRASSEGTTPGYVDAQGANSTTATVAPELRVFRNRGTIASPTTVSSGDTLGYISGLGYTVGGSHIKAAQIHFDVDSAPSSGVCPGRIVFETANASGVMTERLRIDSAGTVTLSAGLGASSGGTGITSYTVGDLIYASGTTTLSTLADVATGNALISGGVGTAPSWGKIGLSTHVSGTLPASSVGSGSFTITGGSVNGATIGNSSASTGAFTTLSATGVVTVSAGSASAPGICFSGDTNTGIYSAGADQLNLTTGGTVRASLSTTALSSTVLLQSPIQTQTILLFEDNTSYTLTEAESGKVVYLQDTTIYGVVTLTLPNNPTIGTYYEFVCSETGGIKMQAQGTMKIYVGTTVTAAAGYVYSRSLCSTMTLKCIGVSGGNKHWVAMSTTGTWTPDTTY